jgi:hypothetical protein
MTSSATQNGQIPTDPTTALLLALALAGVATQLTADQAQAVIAAGCIAEFVLMILHVARGGR